MATQVSDRTSRWTADPGLGVYVHVPFCKHRCHYCDFNTYEGQEELHLAYVDALISDIENLDPGGRSATSIFFGGGTPTLLSATELARILRAVGQNVGVGPGAEVTIEANPETVDEAKFDALLEAGFNRVSIGIQSLVPGVLVRLGRTHSPERALEVVGAARRAGFEEVNADLIYGSPWESTSDWMTSLQGVVAAGPEHISAYALTVEEGTPLHTLVASGRATDVDPDIQAERHELASVVLSAAGYERYEVSNWAKPGYASRHNVLYWSAGDYFGLGAGAHGHRNGRRYWNERLPREFVARVSSDRSTESGSELLDSGARAGEAMMLGLRLASGVQLDEFTLRYGRGWLDAHAGVVAELEAAGLLEHSQGWLRLSAGSTLVANDVLCRLL
ncbi:MAG: radical SAM family heme chaperone HemW [Actinomycetota bacterium]|nr:radical SAM family heme chaperone HemW [Actinomycetota bacterium]